MHVISPAGRAIARTPFELPAARPAPRQSTAGARRVVVYVDRSPEAANAAWRGALVARDRGLPLHLVALQPLHANLADATALTEALAAEVRDKLPLEVFPEGIAGELEHEGLEAARDASLLVVPARPDLPVLRMLRRTARPVLVVRVPAPASYTRVLAAVGPEHVLWGTDSLWDGSPQDQIQAFRAFEISAELQERHGYPALTADLKAPACPESRLSISMKPVTGLKKYMSEMRPETGVQPR